MCKLYSGIDFRHLCLYTMYKWKMEKRYEYLSDNNKG